MRTLTFPLRGPKNGTQRVSFPVVRSTRCISGLNQNTPTDEATTRTGAQWRRSLAGIHHMIISVQAQHCHAKLWLLQLYATSLGCANPAGAVTTGTGTEVP
jgi:hypothetical protein